MQLTSSMIHINQLEVRSAFLNGDLEKVYMEVPLGMEKKFNRSLVCKLRKSL